MRPSLPPIVWKKNSVAVSPVKKLFFTNPFAAGCFEFFSKWGKERSVKPLGTLFILSFFINHVS